MRKAWPEGAAAADRLGSRKEWRHESALSARERTALVHAGGDEISGAASGERADGYHPGVASSPGQCSRRRLLAAGTPLATRGIRPALWGRAGGPRKPGPLRRPGRA